MIIKNIFNPPDYKVVAATELAHAQLQLLKYKAGQEYATAMVTYHEASVKRLTSLLQECKTPLLPVTISMKGENT